MEADRGRWWRDRRLWWLLAMGLALRVVPLAIWSEERCARDECTYLQIAGRMLDGEGMTSSVGWIWPPGYPFFLALHGWLTGYTTIAQGTQIPLAALNAVLIVALARRALGGESPATQRDASHVAAFLYLASPTHIFYTINLWSETLYNLLLLSGLVLLDRSRDALDGGRRPALSAAAWTGLILGLCALFRGIATYALPVFALGLLWRRWDRPLAWASAAMVGLVAALTVAPYSVYATRTFGATVVSDRTLGQMMWLGNNDFDPISFDFGNGVLAPSAYDRHTESGRPHCAPMEEPIARDDCERAAGLRWIKEHPAAFIDRVPLRLAQMFTPHSMLTRHLRWGRWRGMPTPMVEGLILLNAIWSLAVLWLGAVGMAARARGATGLTLAATVAYHIAPVALLAGLSRYRVPIEPILMIYAGYLLVSPRGVLANLRSSPARLALCGGLLGALIPLSLYFLPAGWPEWRTW